MAEKQIRLLKEYIRQLEAENQSKLTEIHALTNSLSTLVQENRALNQQLNFISSNQTLHKLEERIHNLHVAIGEREHEIRRLRKEREQERAHHHYAIGQRNKKGHRSHQIIQIKEQASQEEQKTGSISEETFRIIQEYEMKLKEKDDEITALDQQLMEKQQKINLLLRNESERMKSIEDYMREEHQYQDRIGELSIECDILRSNNQTLQETSAMLSAQNTELSAQIQQLTEQMEAQKQTNRKLNQMDAIQRIKELQNMVSELNVRIMCFELKEEEWDKEWDRESLQSVARINWLRKQLDLLKNEKTNISERQDRQHDFEPENQPAQIENLKHQLREVLQINRSLLKQINQKGEVTSSSTNKTERTACTTPTKGSFTMSFCGITSPKSDVSKPHSNYQSMRELNPKTQHKQGHISKASMANLQESIDELKGQSIIIREYLATVSM